MWCKNYSSSNLVWWNSKHSMRKNQAAPVLNRETEFLTFSVGRYLITSSTVCAPQFWGRELCRRGADPAGRSDSFVGRWISVIVVGAYRMSKTVKGKRGQVYEWKKGTRVSQKVWLWLDGWDQVGQNKREWSGEKWRLWRYNCFSLIKVSCLAFILLYRSCSTGLYLRDLSNPDVARCVHPLNVTTCNAFETVGREEKHTGGLLL